jgi:8-oxo-dGTP diphosphatase
MSGAKVRLGVRAVIVEGGRLLLVNAWPGAQSDLWCAPGGGVEPGLDLPTNLQREVMEETGLQISVGAPCLIKEFHDPETGFHQVDLYFRCALLGVDAGLVWRDPEGIVNRRLWASRAEMAGLRVKPDVLADVAFSASSSAPYDPLERMVR